MTDLEKVEAASHFKMLEALTIQFLSESIPLCLNLHRDLYVDNRSLQCFKRSTVF